MIVENYDLQNQHTLKCPSRAEYWTTIETLESLNIVRQWWQKQGCLLQVMGQGSNVLCAEKVAGLTVSNRLQGYWIEHEDTDKVRVRVGAGMDWHQWVLFCAKQGWHGLENLALIPGSVGASPVQNIGAYGVEVASCIVRLKAFHWHSGELVEWTSDECHFGYRSSVFKTAQQGAWFITDVVFELSKTFAPVLNYAPLDSLDPNQLSAQELIDAVCRVREQKLPNPEHIPNVGSFFINPVLSQQHALALKKTHPELPVFPIDEHYSKVSAAYLIDQSGWKGWQDPNTGVGTWHQHALVMVNPKQSSLSDVLSIAALIQSDIANRFGIELEIEPQPLDDRALQP